VSQLEWTSTPPPDPGFYWAKLGVDAGPEPAVVLLLLRDDRGQVYWPGNAAGVPMGEVLLWWPEPVNVPAKPVPGGR
jgi:hypothetical protein